MGNDQLASIGWSAASNAFVAGQAAARIALQRLSVRQPRCVLVFGSSWFDQSKLLEGVHNVFDGIPIVGGSTAGEITPEGPKSHSCVVLAMAYEDVAVSLGTGTELQQHPRLAGHQAAQQAVKQFNGQTRSGFLMFGDGLLTGYAEVLRGIQEVLGTSSLVTGGLMGDDLRFVQTYQYAQQQVFSQAIVGLLLGGSCTIGVGLEHGFAPISKPRRITRATANILLELDGQPASSVYEDYFGSSVLGTIQQAGFTRQLVAYPLGIQQEARDPFLLRNVMAFGEDGSVVCTGEIPEGAWLQLMIGSKGLALEAASRAAQTAVRPLRDVRFALVFDSVVRLKLLGQEAQREIACIRQILGPSTPLIGCYTYGEQAPLGKPYAYGHSSMQTGSVLVIAIGL